MAHNLQHELQQQAQQALDDIVRANQQQSLQLRQMELA